MSHQASPQDALVPGLKSWHERRTAPAAWRGPAGQPRTTVMFHGPRLCHQAIAIKRLIDFFEDYLPCSVWGSVVAYEELTEYHARAGRPGVVDVERLGRVLVCPSCWREITLEATACGYCGRGFPEPFRCWEPCHVCCGRGAVESRQISSALELCTNCGGHGYFLFDSATPIAACPRCEGQGQRRVWWWGLRRWVIWLIGPAVILGAVLLMSGKPGLPTTWQVTDWGPALVLIVMSLVTGLFISARRPYRRCARCGGTGHINTA